MSRPTRPHARGSASRPRRQLQIEAVQALEERQLLAPFVSTNAPTVTFTAATTPTNGNLGSVAITQGAALASSAAGFTSVSALTFNNAFGGDMVRIEAGPGGDFGKSVYAVSRGAGGNTAAINRPGVIYRVDPATGKASIFFDLNTVLNASASNSLGAETGLVNWYDIAFDPEGYFDGKTSMFVSTVDRTDPNKNVIFRIGSDGSFLGAFVQFTDGLGTGQFSRSPSAILAPPPEQQQFLRGLISGDGSGTGVGGFTGLYFNADLFRPGTDLSGPGLPTGVFTTGLTLGPQTGLTSTSTSIDYGDLIYSTFTNFGDPGGPNSSPIPGLSGVQGISGALLINGGQNIGFSFTDPDSASPDTAAAIITPFRRFQDITYDKYGYFSYGATVTPNAGALPTIAPIPPDYVGNVFVADLATGLSQTVTPVAPLPTTPTVQVPIQSDGTIGLETNSRGEVVPTFDPVTGVYAQNASNFQGGRIIRISPDGTVTNFAENFATSPRQDSASFVESTLSISFSADGTTLYAADNEGIWQFKSVLSLAGSSTGTIVGLNDLRSLGVPYDGQDSAVAVVDTGIDQLTPPFRGRVANGHSVFTKRFGNDDPTPTTIPNGHGTLIAGAISQFVPQSTLVPVNVFTPNAIATNGTTSLMLFRGLDWLQKNPYTRDPIRPNKVDRIITSAIGFGTTYTFETEMTAYGLDAYPQIVLGLKGVVSRLRRMGNQPIAAAGQFGIPVGSGQAASTTVGDLKGEPLPAILNEVISVTGTYPFPFLPTATTPPNDPADGAIPRPIAPLVISGGVSTVSTGAELAGQAGIVGAGDLIVYTDKLLASANRTWTTDYAAPAVDIPTFRRTFAGGGPGYNVFQEGGTSLSAGVMTGSYAMVASALDYWIDLARTQDGVTVDAYLNTPVGTRQLAFGSHGLADLGAYANADGVNSILEWTAVPTEDMPNLTETINPEPLFGLDSFRNYARVDVGNAIAAIEGTVAIDYLFKNGQFNTIDQNKDGAITAQELQIFVDRSATIGLPEAGAMARLLGGTATTPQFGFQPTAYFEFPDQPDALQRRYNFFDWAADGQLNGVISVDQFRVLGHNLLPAPDAFTVTDRQRASVNQFLVDAHAPRNFYQLKHLLPTFVWVPQSLAKKFSNPRVLAWVGRRELPANVAPFYNLFEQSPTPVTARTRRTSNKPSDNGSTGGDSGSTGTTTGSNTGATGSDTGSKTGTPVANQPDTVTNPTTTVTQGNSSQAILDALVALANRNKTTPSTPGAPTPAASLLAAATDRTTAPTTTTTDETPAQGGIPASNRSGEDTAVDLIATTSAPQATAQRPTQQSMRESGAISSSKPARRGSSTPANGRSWPRSWASTRTRTCGTSSRTTSLAGCKPAPSRDRLVLTRPVHQSWRPLPSGRGRHFVHKAGHQASVWPRALVAPSVARRGPIR